MIYCTDINKAQIQIKESYKFPHPSTNRVKVGNAGKKCTNVYMYVIRKVVLLSNLPILMQMM